MYFLCHQCGYRYPIRQLTKHNTHIGDYCPTCAQQQKCAACGELTDSDNLTYKPDAQNYICTHCLDDYHEVLQYITPLTHLKRHQLPQLLKAS